MTTSRLLLEHYFVEEASVVAVLDAEECREDSPPPVTRRAYAAAPDDPGLFQVRLTVEVGHGDGHSGPYRVRVALRGLFRVDDGVTDRKIRDALLSNTAPSILYGAARELVMTLTGRGPHPPLLLPAEVFAPRKLSLGPEPEPEGAAAPGKAPKAAKRPRKTPGKGA